MGDLREAPRLNDQSSRVSILGAGTSKDRSYRSDPIQVPNPYRYAKSRIFAEPVLSFATMSSQSETLPSWIRSWTYEGPYLPLAVTHPSKALTGSYEPVLSAGANDVSDPNSIRTGLLIAACFVVDMFNQRRR
jgi:hypothetical protein